MAQTVLTTATSQEIYQQPTLWPLTLALIENSRSIGELNGRPAVITGAGTSAYSAAAIAGTWPNAQGIPTTDLLIDLGAIPSNTEIFVSIGRSGDSPETMAVIERVRKRFPRLRHIAISCNPSGKLASAEGIETILLDARSNDRSLVMTSSFSNLTLAGMALQHAPLLGSALPEICRTVEARLPQLDEIAADAAERRPLRAAILASRQLFPLAREASLKILEMTGGKCVSLAETFLGLRHGPMSFLTPDCLVLCLLASDPTVRLYELDLIAELRAKRLGHVIAIVPESGERVDVDQVIPASAAMLPDPLRIPFEVVFAQLLAYHLSLNAGLNPDNPSPDGIITRVVGGIRFHGE